MQPVIKHNLNVTSAPLNRGMKFWTTRLAAGVTEEVFLNTANELYHRVDPVSQEVIVRFFSDYLDITFVPPSTGIHAPTGAVLNSLKRDVAQKTHDLNTANDTIAELKKRLASISKKNKAK